MTGGLGYIDTTAGLLATVPASLCALHTYEPAHANRQEFDQRSDNMYHTQNYDTGFSKEDNNNNNNNNNNNDDDDDDDDDGGGGDDDDPQQQQSNNVSKSSSATHPGVCLAGRRGTASARRHHQGARRP
jgi:hypothetical protein